MTEEVVRKWKREIYPWDELKNSGDSFIVPTEKCKTGRQLVFAANNKAGGKVYRFDSGSGEVIKL